MYTAGGERIWTIDNAGSLVESVTLRGLAGKVLRRYSISGRGGTEAWAWEQDYVYRRGELLTGELPSGQRNFHRDHLGNTRLLTSAAKLMLDRFAYFPYGAQRSQSGSLIESMRFTGHERDTNGVGSAGTGDYMHARYYSPHLTRFQRTDPRRGDPSVPQSMNRYAYALGSPVVFVDPLGEAAVVFCGGFSGSQCGDSNILDWIAWLSTIPGIGEIMTFGYGEWEEATLWLQTQMIADPTEYFLIVGYSNGGVSGINSANALAGFGYLVDMLIVVDAQTADFSSIPAVASGVQTVAYYGSALLGGELVSGPDVTNIFLPGVSHQDAPAAPFGDAIRRAIGDAVQKILDSWPGDDPSGPGSPGGSGYINVNTGRPTTAPGGPDHNPPLAPPCYMEVSEFNGMLEETMVCNAMAP